MSDVNLVEGKPLIFDSRSTLQRWLTGPLVRAGIEDFLSRAPWTTEEVLTKSVDETTVRAIHTRTSHGVAPLNRYRTWGREYLGEHWEEFVRADADSYQSTLDIAVASLQDAFATSTGGNYAMTYGRAAKMINLTLKHFALHEELTAAERIAFLGKTHVALDRYTLATIPLLAPQLGLPRNPSMGAVELRDRYLVVQEWIKAACDEVGETPSTYEVATFNVPRGVWRERPLALLSSIPREPPSSGSAGKGRPRASDGSSRGHVSTKRAASDQGVEAGPHTSPHAKVCAHRQVRRALVIEATDAFWRGASFSGRMQVVDASDIEVAQASTGPRRVRAVLDWFGWRPQQGYGLVRVTGPCDGYANFDGEVIAGLGE